MYKKFLEDLNLLSVIEQDKIIISQLKKVHSNTNKRRDSILSAAGLILANYSVADNKLSISQLKKKSEIRNIKNILYKDFDAYTNEKIDSISSILKEKASESFNFQGYIASVGRNDFIPRILNDEIVDELVDSEFKGKTYSDRLIENNKNINISIEREFKKLFAGTLLSHHFLKKIKDIYLREIYETNRLALTESMRIHNEVTDLFAEYENYTHCIYCATLDARTCATCGDFDGNEYKLSDSSRPSLPHHPRCRCIYLNTDDRWIPTKRKDGLTKEYIDYTKYNQWKIKNNL